MWFRSPIHARKTRRLALPAQRSPRHPFARLRVEALEDRTLLSGFVTLAASDDSHLVGERVTWTATATEVGSAPVYRFSAATHGGVFHVLRDFSPANTFTWTPMQEGSYDVRGTVKDGFQATETASAVATDEVASRVTGSQAVVTPAANPLVAHYSVPPLRRARCSASSRWRATTRNGGPQSPYRPAAQLGFWATTGADCGEELQPGCRGGPKKT